MKRKAFILNFLLISVVPLVLTANDPYINHPQAIVSDFQVNSNGGHSSQTTPDVAVDKNGNFICVWEDSRNENGLEGGFFGLAGGDIYAQRFDQNGNLIGNNFKVNDDGTLFRQQLPVVAAGGNGNFIVTWLDERESTASDGVQNIYAQRYAADGTPSGNNFRVNGEGMFSLMQKPAISADNSGNFIIVWTAESQEPGVTDLFAQRYLADGSPVGNSIIVSTFPDRYESRNPAIAMSGTGEFAIAFEAYYMSDRPPDILLQRFDAEGIPLDSNIIVDNHPIEEVQVENPVIGMDANNNILVGWQDTRNGYYNQSIYCQWFDKNGTALTGNFDLFNDADNITPYYVNLAVADDGAYCVVWMEMSLGQVMAQRFSSDSTASGKPFALSESPLWMPPDNPAMAMNDNGRFLVAWSDMENYINYTNTRPFSDIWGQYVQADSTRLDQAIQISDDEGSGNQIQSDIAADSSGNFTVVWEDWRDDPGDIYLRRYTSNGTARGEQIKVNQDEAGTKNLDPAVAIDTSGLTLVVWEDFNVNPAKIFGQFYSPDGVALGENFEVNSNLGEGEHLNPDVAALGNKTFIITWQLSTWNIGGQVYSQESGQVGSGFYVNDITTDYKNRENPAVTADDSGRFTIAWQDARSGAHIYAQQYDQNGNPDGGNIQVSQPDGWGIEPAIAYKSDGSLYIVWTGNGITLQRLSSSGALIGTNVPITDPFTQEYSPMKPDISMDQDRAIITWEVANYFDYLSEGIFGLRVSEAGTSIDTIFQMNGPGALNPTEIHVSLVDNRIYSTWTDNLRDETSWNIYANVLDFDNPLISSSEKSETLVTDYVLYQNYPNPFNPITAIGYQLSAVSFVNLTIYNSLGQKITTLVHEQKPPGKYQVEWDASGFSSGIYFYKLETSGNVLVRKMLLIK